LDFHRRLELILAVAIIVFPMAALGFRLLHAEQFLAQLERKSADAQPIFGRLFQDRLRIGLITQNIANAEVTRDSRGKTYQRQWVRFEEHPFRYSDGFIANADQANPVKISLNSASRVFFPDHPDADAHGFVGYPDIDVTREMADLFVASQNYTSNLFVLAELLHLGRSAD